MNKLIKILESIGIAIVILLRISAFIGLISIIILPFAAILWVGINMLANIIGEWIVLAIALGVVIAYFAIGIYRNIWWEMIYIKDKCLEEHCRINKFSEDEMNDEEPLSITEDSLEYNSFKLSWETRRFIDVVSNELVEKRDIIKSKINYIMNKIRKGKD